MADSENGPWHWISLHNLTELKISSDWMQVYKDIQYVLSFDFIQVETGLKYNQIMHINAAHIPATSFMLYWV